MNLWNGNKLEHTSRSRSRGEAEGEGEQQEQGTKRREAKNGLIYC